MYRKADNGAIMISFGNNRISICKEVAVTPEVVWKTLTDTQLWPLWGPSLVDVECSDRYITAGSSGRVKTLFCFWLPFTVTVFRPMESWSWKIGSVEATGHKLIRKSDSLCTICFDMAWWAFFYIPVCWLALLNIEKTAAKTDSPV